MKLSPLNQVRTLQDVVSVFKGYNRNPSIDVGEFFDMENLSSNAFPLLTTRPQRGFLYNPLTPYVNMVVRASRSYIQVMPEEFLWAVHTQEGIYDFVYDSGTWKLDGEAVDLDHYGISNAGILPFSVKASKSIEGCVEFNEKLYVVRADNLYEYNDIRRDKKAELKFNMGERQLIVMGGKLIIFPDKLIYDGTSLTEMEAEWTGTSITTTPCVVGSEGATVSNSEPPTPSDGDYWLNSSTAPYTLMKYSAATASWVQIPTDCVKLNAIMLGRDFAVGDGVKIEGLEGDPEIEALNGAAVIRNTDGTSFITISGMVSTQQIWSNLTISISRTIPDMDYIIECRNRLWGCKYGSGLNEIYASKLGDPTNFNCFDGLSTDSFAATVGKDGSFTGAVNYFGYPLFFKEDTLYKVHGDYPANFRVIDSPVKGVAKGSNRSLAIVGSTLYYKSRNGVCAYNGSLPTEIVVPFGGIQYTEAVGGAYNDKYYISMKSGEWNLFVFDTIRGLLHREDNTHASFFCATRDDLIYLDADTKDAMTANGFGTKDLTTIKWMADTGEIGMTTQASYRGRAQLPGKKYISRMLVRFSLDIGSTIEFYIMYDSNGKWEKVTSSTEARLGSLTTEIRPKRCDHFRIKIVGEGSAKIYSLTKIYRKGSDF